MNTGVRASSEPMPNRRARPGGRYAGWLFSRPGMYALAVAGPGAASLIASRVEFFRGIPLSIHFIVTSVIAMVGGFLPALVCVVVTVVSHAALPIPPQARWEILWPDISRTGVLLTSALVISAIGNSRRRSSARLAAALDELEERTADLTLAQQGSRCAAWTIDAEGKVRWHHGGYEVFGVPFDRIDRVSAIILHTHADDRQRCRDEIRRAIDTRTPLHLEYRVLFPSGEIRWSECRGALLPGDPPTWRGVTFDITDRKLTEQTMIRTEKLAAMGRLASTVAHEVNNPLESVTNLLFLARGDESIGEETRAYLLTAESELGRLADITRLTLGFVRNSATKADIDAAVLADEVLSLFRLRLEMKHIRVERSYEPGVRFHIVPHELRQVLTNLISNASDALTGQGAILRIAVKRENDCAVLLCQDNGSGIAPADLQRIFEPFFSTKEDVGTGIGLWVSRELIEKNGGTISAESGDLGDGFRTSFRIELPLVSAPA